MEQNNYFNAAHPLHPYTRFLPRSIRGRRLLKTHYVEKSPRPRAGYHPWEKNEKWISIEDHRGEYGYLNGAPYTIDDFGPYPNGWSITPPEPTEEESKQTRIAE